MLLNGHREIAHQGNDVVLFFRQNSPTACRTGTVTLRVDVKDSIKINFIHYLLKQNIHKIINIIPNSIMASKIPCSTSQTESTVFGSPLAKVWSGFRTLAFEKIAPGTVSATEFESGAEGVVGAVVKITYTDGTVWRIRVTEFSERHHTLAYELLTAEPATTVTSVQGEFKMLSVTSNDTTFFSWMTEFSNDVDLAVMSDQKYKKQEIFKAIKKPGDFNGFC